MKVTANIMHYKELNDMIRESEDKTITIDNCIGQRFIGSGLDGKEIIINGTPGNALGAYLNGSKIIVNGNVQDAVGDTMNTGEIIVHGSSGDATGYAMRGGKIFVEGNTGYRAGIHMKAYKEKVPVLVIGGTAGSFLGEYQAGGIIVVLGLESTGKIPVGDFCGTGMHGGKMFLRCEELPSDLPPQVVSKTALKEDLEEILPVIKEFCIEFDKDFNNIINSHFFVLSADTKNPYKQLYTHN